MPGHGFLDYSFIPVAETGKPYPVPVGIFGNYIKKLNPACPAFDAVTLHADNSSILLIIGVRFAIFIAKNPNSPGILGKRLVFPISGWVDFAIEIICPPKAGRESGRHSYLLRAFSQRLRAQTCGLLDTKPGPVAPYSCLSQDVMPAAFPACFKVTQYF